MSRHTDREILKRLLEISTQKLLSRAKTTLSQNNTKEFHK